MPVVTEELLQEIVDRIVAEVAPERIILFGSQARGDAHEHSDVDLIVLEAEPFDESRTKRSEEVRVHFALWGLGVPTDILVYTLEEVEYWKDSLNNVLARALREGRALYERR